MKEVYFSEDLFHIFYFYSTAIKCNMLFLSFS